MTFGTGRATWEAGQLSSHAGRATLNEHQLSFGRGRVIGRLPRHVQSLDDPPQILFRICLRDETEVYIVALRLGRSRLSVLKGIQMAAAAVAAFHLPGNHATGQRTSEKDKLLARPAGVEVVVQIFDGVLIVVMLLLVDAGSVLAQRVDSPAVSIKLLIILIQLLIVGDDPVLHHEMVFLRLNNALLLLIDSHQRTEGRRRRL